MSKEINAGRAGRAGRSRRRGGPSRPADPVSQTAGRLADPVPRTAGRFLELLGAMKRYVRDEISPNSDRGMSMSDEKFRSLLGLRFLGRSQLKDLARHDGLSASAQCIMLNRLVDDGFAERTGDSRDRRNTFYELSDSGQALLSGEIARRRGTVAASLEGFSRAEVVEFARGIETVFAGLEKLTARALESGQRKYDSAPS